MGGSRW